MNIHSMQRPGMPGRWNIVLAALLALAAVLAVRAFTLTSRVHPGDEPIRAWMTVPYISHSRHVSQNVLWGALGIPSHLHDHRPLGRIAREQNRPIADILANLKAALEHPSKADR